MSKNIRFEHINAGRDGFAVTPNDSADLTRPVRFLYVGGSGDIKLDTVEGTTLTFSSVPVGIFPISCKKVHSTDTTATNIIGMD